MSTPPRGFFTKIPNQLIPDLRQLTRDEIILWLHLQSRCHNKDHCWPSYKTIMRDLGLKWKSHLRRPMKGLEKKGWLTIKNRTRESNTYYPKPPDGLITEGTYSDATIGNTKTRPSPVAQGADQGEIQRLRHEEEKGKRQIEEERPQIHLNDLSPLPGETKNAFRLRVAKALIVASTQKIERRSEIMDLLLFRLMSYYPGYQTFDSPSEEKEFNRDLERLIQPYAPTRHF